MIAESGVSRIIEVDREGKLVHQMPLKVSAPRILIAIHALFVNSIRATTLSATKAMGCVREYKPSGEIAWEYAVPLFDKKPAPATA